MLFLLIVPAIEAFKTDTPLVHLAAGRVEVLLGAPLERFLQVEVYSMRNLFW
jgi:hypothetical protein